MYRSSKIKAEFSLSELNSAYKEGERLHEIGNITQ